MLRETHAAASDAACLDDTEAADAYGNLGAELDGAPPEVRAAAVVRSRRLPEPDTVRAAWRSLPLAARDRIGEEALIHSFYTVGIGLDVQGLTLSAGVQAERTASAALTKVDALATAALPRLYGAGGADPAWALSDDPLVFALPPEPAVSGPTALPPAVHAEAAARSRLVPGLGAILRAWHGLPPETQSQLGAAAIAGAFYGWLTDDANQAPADRWLTDSAIARSQHRADRAFNRIGDLARRALPELFGTKRRDPVWARGDDAPGGLEVRHHALSPLAQAIAGHRAAHAAKRARGDYEGGEPDDAWIALDHAEFDGLNAVLAAPCADRADAAAMLAHLGAYVAAEKEGLLRDEGEPACAVAEALCRALTVALATPPEPTHTASRTLM